MTNYSTILADLTETYVYSTARSRQQLVLEIDDTNGVRLFVRETYGGDALPAAVWHRRVLWINLLSGSYAINRDELAADLDDGGWLATRIDRIRNGHHTAYDAQSNHVGELTEDARDAILEIENAEGNGRWADVYAEIWDAYEWLLSSGDTAADVLTSLNLSTDATDEHIAAVAKLVELDAGRDANATLVDTRGAIRRIIDEAASDQDA